MFAPKKPGFAHPCSLFRCFHYSFVRFSDPHCNDLLFDYQQLGINPETGTPPIITGKDTGITGLAYLSPLLYNLIPVSNTKDSVKLPFNLKLYHVHSKLLYIGGSKTELRKPNDIRKPNILNFNFLMVGFSNHHSKTELSKTAALAQIVLFNIKKKLFPGTESPKIR